MHFAHDPFCHCNACREYEWSLPERAQTRRGYFLLEWPRLAFVDMCPLRMIDCEEMIERAYEDQENQQDDDRL